MNNCQIINVAVAQFNTGMADEIKSCTVDGCQRPLRARGYCANHWALWRRNGKPEKQHRHTYETCTVDKCDQKPRSSTSPYCEKHYYRLRRTGTTAEPQWINGQCTADGCNQPATCNGDSAGHPGAIYCRMHFLRVKTRGDASFEFRGQNHHKWTGDQISNGGLHQRIRKNRGSARNYSCVDCGNQAAHWSYDHQALDERYDEIKGPYTPDESHYEPRCVPCHKKFDLNRLKGREQRSYG